LIHAIYPRIGDVGVCTSKEYLSEHAILAPCNEEISGLNSAIITTPLWAKCEDETHTLKSGNLESSGTPKNSELDCRGQSTLHWGIIYIVEKVLKCRCPKWPRMSHLDIYSPSYGQKKGRESNWKFDS
jgi:hypothetical protein